MTGKIVCANCGREIERGNVVNGVVYCARCVYEGEMPSKNVEKDWGRFSRTKHRRTQWR